AQPALSDAKTQLAYTRVRAPYDGVIVSTSVNPGEAVEVGQPLVELLDSRRLDIPVLLDEQQWQLLAADWQDRQAEVQNIRGDQRWHARMERQGGQVERDSRLRRLYLSVEQPGALSATAQPEVALLPGEFVRVQLPGRRFATPLR
ncbi:HlyD family efflux transporter periplasmic adaptor subunit, partial [Myxococcus sp. AM001]|nr:HlyD family efflux transporter periplasmic adaptor subunit [Myxococcus sp. AM001]